MNITVSEMAARFKLTTAAGDPEPAAVIESVYIGDLLSWVMGRARENCAWITIQGHVNIVAVALLINAACIIIAEGAKPERDTLARAESEGIPVYTTELTEYEAAALFAGLS